MLKGIIFDFDGLILDSFLDQYRWFKKICSLLNKKFDYKNHEEFRKDYREPVYPDMYAFLGFEWGKEKEIIWKEYNFHKKNAKIKLINGIEKVIKHSSNLGYSLGIASSNTREIIEKYIRRHDLQEYFSIIICKEDLPLENGEPKLKPNPEMLVLCLEKMKLLPREAIYIGDQTSDIKACRNVEKIFGEKLETIAVTFGYSEKEKLIQNNPDYLAENTESLLKIISSLKSGNLK